jgi:carbonic anhydrase
MMSKLLLLALSAGSLIAAVSADGAGHDWDYTNSYGRVDPAKWSQKYPTCGGSRQSPIDVTASSLYTDKNLKPIKFIGYDQPLSDLNIQNDGHTFKVTIPAKYNLMIESPSLSAPYKLTQFHFHWPSEHTIGGKHYPLELHFVHVNTKMNSTETLSKDAGLAVVAVMFERGIRSPAALRTLTTNMEIYTDEEGESTNMTTSITLTDLLPSDKTSYIRYSGSLTTPPCAEVVEFHIMTKTNTVTNTDLNRFKGLTHEVHLSEGEEYETEIERNDRPAQPLNGRKVRVSGSIGDLIYNL